MNRLIFGMAIPTMKDILFQRMGGILMTFFKTVAPALLLILAFGTATAQPKITPRLQSAYSETGRPILAMVYFAPRERSGLGKLSDPSVLVSPAALARRANVLPADRLVDESDLPIDENTVGAVALTGATIRHRLKWFNAVSIEGSRTQIEAISRLPGVSSVDIIGRFKKTTAVSPAEVSVPEASLGKVSAVSGLDYGSSANALNMINIPAVHATGNHAEGIIIGVFDNGFRLLSHHAFDTLRPRIIGTHDFVDHKTSVIPNNTNTSFGTHGVHTLSTVGAYWPGRCMGPAFGATFILARTENDSSETPIEEDNWAAAIQWAESLGVQVTSTSLGYLTFDAPYTSWTWVDMDGKTTVITRAAAMAVRKGVVVVNSAGNEGAQINGHNTLGAPADADSVITVGAVDASGVRAYFSSEGPTTSIPPRIKPDVMAQGVQVYVASSVNDTVLTTDSGTSFSCPLTASAAALVLKAHPKASPYEIAQRLRLTASNASSPNNVTGWGTINTLAAINYSGALNVETPHPVPGPVILAAHPNPFSGGTTFSFTVNEPSTVTVGIYDVLGREVRIFPQVYQQSTSGSVTWNGTNISGQRVTPGVYFVRVTLSGASGAVTRDVRKILLLS
jgi:hypothetical protein